MINIFHISPALFPLEKTTSRDIPQTITRASLCDYKTYTAQLNSLLFATQLGGLPRPLICLTDVIDSPFCANYPKTKWSTNKFRKKEPLFVIIAISPKNGANKILKIRILMDRFDMLDKNEFQSLMQQISEGSEDAAWIVVEHYGELIRRAVRRILNKRLRSKFDSMDFVQLVWSSFFRARNRLDRFERPEELTAFLVTIARNKVGMEIRRRLNTVKYDLHREHSLSDPFIVRSNISDSKPLPIDVAIAREQWDRFLSEQPNRYREIIKLRLLGRTYQDIADTLQIDERTVRRFLKKLLLKRVA